MQRPNEPRIEMEARLITDMNAAIAALVEIGFDRGDIQDILNDQLGNLEVS